MITRSLKKVTWLYVLILVFRDLLLVNVHSFHCLIIKVVSQLYTPYIYLSVNSVVQRQMAFDTGDRKRLGVLWRGQGQAPSTSMHRFTFYPFPLKVTIRGCCKCIMQLAKHIWQLFIKRKRMKAITGIYKRCRCYSFVVRSCAYYSLHG